MSTPLDKLLDSLQTAATPADSALAVADFATAKSPDLARALIVASIPHWFTQESLVALLDEDLAPRAVELHSALLALPMVEDYPERSAHAVHDQTRLALRDRLWQTDPERFKELSCRAASAYGSADPTVQDVALTCEHIYHWHGTLPKEGWINWILSLTPTLLGYWNSEDIQLLARALAEFYPGAQFLDEAWKEGAVNGLIPRGLTCIIHEGKKEG